MEAGSMLLVLQTKISHKLMGHGVRRLSSGKLVSRRVRLAVLGAS